MSSEFSLIIDYYVHCQYQIASICQIDKAFDNQFIVNVPICFKNSPEINGKFSTFQGEPVFICTYARYRIPNSPSKQLIITRQVPSLGNCYRIICVEYGEAMWFFHMYGIWGLQ